MSTLVGFAFIGHSTAFAASKAEIDIEVKQAIKRFKKDVGSADEYLKIAKGMLVFPSVFKAGIGIGGEYGEGAMLINGKTVQYYSTAAGSFGFQLGAQTKTIIMLFTTTKALNKFRHSDGWEAGVDGSVALIDIGAAKTIDTNSIKNPIIAFVFNNKGLMYNLSLEGSKFTKIDR
jgi:lipid-binding SYLF domain-containing protein